MEKKSVLQAYRVLLDQTLSSQESIIKETASIVRDAPGSNVTRSDTSRFQYGNQHLGQQLVLEATRECMASLEDGERKSDIVRPGALVCLEDDQGVVSWFLILRKASALIVNIEGVAVTAISIETPLSKAMIDKVLGDEVEFRDKVFSVVDVR